MVKIFIDGSAGTTGLRIYERLENRKDISLIILDDDKRKNIDYRKEAINSSDISFLCLPDAAAVEAVSLVENKDTCIIDTSTAHRTNELFTYGFAEINGLKEKIKTSKRIANPGCHASGFISLIAPLVSAGVLKATEKLSATSLTGYSGGGKKMIADYENDERSSLLSGPRMYGLTQAHKHLPEMKKVCGIENDPVFCPIVGDFYSGMQVSVPLDCDMVSCSIDEIKDIYKDYYNSPIVSYDESIIENGFASSVALAGKDSMKIAVVGNEERIVLLSTYDNLGKGASGAAIQNMNIVLGVDETTGLEL